MNEISLKKSRYPRILATAASLCFGVLSTMNTVMAEPTTTLFQKANAAIKTVYNEIFSISTGLWAVSMLVCFITYMFVRSEKAMGTAKKGAITISIAYLGINCLGWISQLFATLTTGGNYNFQ